MRIVSSAIELKCCSWLKRCSKIAHIVAAGIPDGGHYYREKNPAALNLFFCIFRLDALREAWRDRDCWSAYKFHPSYGNEVLSQRPELNLKRVSWEDGEPYYPLFWCLLSKGGRFFYLKEQLNRSRWSSCVTLDSGQVIAEHLWYLRNWFSKEVMPGHDCSNRQRYEHLRNEILFQYKADPRFLIPLARNSVCRYGDSIRDRAFKLFNRHHAARFGSPLFATIGQTSSTTYLGQTESSRNLCRRARN